MKLSIIIPVYNKAPFLRRCLDSISPADGVEVIVVDDGSTDGGSEILNEYKDKFKITKKTNTNFGVSWTRNIGLYEATGEYVTFLDADDEMSKDGIRTMLGATNRGADIIQFNHWRVNDGWEQMRFVNKSGHYTLDNLPQKWVLVWNKIYRKEFLTEHGILFPWNVGFEEDRIFNLKCLRYTDRIVCINEGTVIKHFDDKQSICHTVDRRKIFEITAALTNLLKEDNINSPELENIIRRCIVELWESKNAKRIFGGG